MKLKSTDINIRDSGHQPGPSLPERNPSFEPRPLSAELHPSNNRPPIQPADAARLQQMQNQVILARNILRPPPRRTKGFKGLLTAGFQLFPFLEGLSVISHLGYVVTYIAFIVSALLAVHKSGSLDFRWFFLGYWVDMGLELLFVLILYSLEESEVQIVKHWKVWVPLLMKAIVLSFATVDAYKGTRITIGVFYMALLVVFFRCTDKFTDMHKRVKAADGLFTLMVGIAEIMFLIRWKVGGSQSYMSIFLYIFYFLLVLSACVCCALIMALCTIFRSICSPEERKKLKMPLMIVFAAIDITLLLIASYFFASLLNVAVDGKGFTTFGEFASELKFQQDRFRSLMIFCIIYAPLRFLICFFLKKKVLEEAVAASAALESLFNNLGVDSKPQVSKAGGMMNLVKSGSNFYAPQNEAMISQYRRQKTAGGEDLCTICYANQPDCIILDCHHGGICKACSIDFLTKKNECPFCRKNILKVCVVKKVDDTRFEIVEEIKPTN